MRIRPGFTLIELVVVIFISGMMSYILYMAFLSMMESRTGIMSRSVFVTRMPLVYNQLARDINGMYVPEPAISDLVRDTKKQAGEQTGQQAEEGQAGQQQAENGAGQEQEERKHPMRADTAWMISYDNNLVSMISGVTTNPMTLNNTPNRVRFVYSRVYNEETEASTLYRYQATDIAQTPDTILQQEEGVELLSGITDMEVTMYIPEEKEQEQNQQQGQEQTQNGQEQSGEEEVVTYRIIEQWPEKDEDDKPKYLLPAYVDIRMAGTDGYDRPFDVTYSFVVAAFDGVHHTYQQEQEQDTDGKQQQSQQQQQTQQGGQQQTAQQQTGEAAEQAGGQKAQQKTVKTRTWVQPITIPNQVVTRKEVYDTKHTS